MKSKHKIALAMLISLGLLAWTPAARAKSVGPMRNADHHDSLRIISMIKHHRIHLPTRINRINTQLLKNHQNERIHNADQHRSDVNRSVATDHHSFNDYPEESSHQMTRSAAQNSKKTDQSSKHDVKKLQKTNGHRNDRSEARSLVYNQTHLPNKPQVDKSHRLISGMKHFVNERRPYRYVQIGANTRDLGGYPTADHKYQTKIDRIIRSADLDGLSKSGVKALQQLHVSKIVDLRYQSSKSGIQSHPDPDELHNRTLKGTSVVYQKNPVYSYNEAQQFSHYMKHHDIHGEYYFYGAPSVTEPQAVNAYRKIFSDLLNNQHGAILFHCNLGRDRTGVTSALILSALGVDQNVIYHDYLLTDYYHYNFHHQPYSKPAGELKYFFDTIDQKYDSVHDYLHQVIGLSDDDIQQLRSMYLVPSNVHQTINRSKSVSKQTRKNKGRSSAENAVKRSNHRTNRTLRGSKH